jgi:hypothetical protein
MVGPQSPVPAEQATNDWLVTAADVQRRPRPTDPGIARCKRGGTGDLGTEPFGSSAVAEHAVDRLRAGRMALDCLAALDAGAVGGAGPIAATAALIYRLYGHEQPASSLLTARVSSAILRPRG